MPPEVKMAADSPGLWVMAVVAVVFVGAQSILYMWLAFRTAGKIGFSRGKCTKGVVSGGVAAIGPAMAMIVVMVAMMEIVGAPITWLRLSMIGGAPTDLAAAGLGANACGCSDLRSPQFNVGALSASVWAMGINTVGWLLFVALFGKHIERLRERAGGGDPRWLALLSGATMLGAFAYLNCRYVVPPIYDLVHHFAPHVFAAPIIPPDLKKSFGQVAAAITGGLSMVVFLKSGKWVPWLKDYALGFAMLAGLGMGTLVLNLCRHL